MSGGSGVRQLVAVGRPAPGEGRRLVLAVGLAAGATGAAVALLATSGYLISRAAQRPMLIALAVTITAVRAFGISRAGLRYAERLASHELALRQLARLRVAFFARLTPLVPGEVRRHGRGELLARFVGDTDTIADLYLRMLIPMAVAGVVVAGAAAAAWLILPALGLVVGAALLAEGAVSMWLANRLGAAAARRQGPVRAELTGRLIEAVDGSAELALAGRSRAAVADLAAVDGRLGGLLRRDATASAAASGLHAAVGAAGLVAVLIVAVGAVHDHGMPGVLVAAVLLLFLGAREATAPLASAVQRGRAVASSAGRLEQIRSAAPPVAEAPDPVAVPADGPLCVEAARLVYEPGGEPVLDGLDLELKPGERVALLGESGAGKTTLAELLVRFRDPQAGRVCLGGVDIRRLRQDDLRATVLLCGQDAHLFNTSIRDNLLIGRRDAEEADLWYVLATVELADWVAALPRGLDTGVGQHGELVSGGQRRRLALARALLSPARFLVLDEPVAHLDPPLAARILDRILSGSGDWAVLVITHETAGLDGFDRTLWLAEGRLTALAAGAAAA